MKKVMLLVLFALLVVGLATAQSFIPKTDVLGAHNNGGRGCAGCHAPHSGARGNGGTLSPNGTKTGGGNEGDWHLWGQDVSLITQETLQFGFGYDCAYYHSCAIVNFGGEQQWTILSNPMVSGIAVCLSCHDGNVSQGAMMLNQAYEYNNNLLPNGAGNGTTHGALYGGNSIPTLLGNDGGTLGDYLNDHPVGNYANFNALNYPQPLQNYGLSFTTTVNNGQASVVYTVASGTPYANFVNNYGYPGILGMVVDATNTVPYVVCTTCHNQHQMNVYLSSSGSPIQGNTAGSYATYFFVNAPYNMGAAWTPTAAPSTTQFCRQCHFGEANEAYGLNGVTTAF
jgi:hypothetical protein